MDTVFTVFWIGLLALLAPALALGIASLVVNFALHLVGLPLLLLRLPFLVFAPRSGVSRSLGRILDRLRKTREKVAALRDAVLIPLYKPLGKILKLWILAGLAALVLWTTLKKPLLPLFILFAWFVAWKVIPWLYVKIARGVFGFKAEMTPITAKRVKRFKSIKRGYYSFVAITTLFVASLFLELVVNNKPLAIRYGESTAFPAFAEWFDKVLAFLWWGFWAVLFVVALGFVWKGVLAARRMLIGDAPSPTVSFLTIFAPLVLLLVVAAFVAGPAALGLVSGIDRPTISAFQKKSDFGQLGESEVDYERFKAWSDDPEVALAAIQTRRDELAAEKEAFATEHPKPGPEEGEKALGRWERRWERTEKKWERMEADIEQMAANVRVLEAGDAWALMPMYPHHYEEYRLNLGKPPPNKPSFALGIPLGTDMSGRDVVPILLYGFRISLAFALIVAAAGYLIGVVVGGVQGYYGGWVDILSQRFVEIWGSIPFLFTMMIIASLITPTLGLLIAMLVVLRSWLGITFYVRGEFYREKAKDYVQAAIGAGVSDKKIILGHILPNSLVPVVTFAPFGIVAYIGSLVSLDYLGFGLPPGTPSWGALLRQGLENVKFYPHLAIVPSAALALTLFCVVMIGEAVREAFDPKVFSRLR